MDIYNQILDLLEKEFCLSEGTNHIPEEKHSLLREVSDILEKYWAEWDFEGVELMAGIGSKSLHISLTSSDIIAENGRKNNLFRLATLADTVRFSQKEKDDRCLISVILILHSSSAIGFISTTPHGTVSTVISSTSTGLVFSAPISVRNAVTGAMGYGQRCVFTCMGITQRGFVRSTIALAPCASTV